MSWVTVDGLPPPLPDDVCPPNDPSGWRGGIVNSGPDVGLWTSIVLSPSGTPMVTYYDATNEQLKFASSTDGVTWATHVVYSNSGSDAGRYSKMVLVNGNPVVAYLVIDTGTNGYSRTRVSIAQSTVALPTQSSDWQVQDALVDNDQPVPRAGLRHRAGVRGLDRGVHGDLRRLRRRVRLGRRLHRGLGRPARARRSRRRATSTRTRRPSAITSTSPRSRTGSGSWSTTASTETSSG